jgi:uncharacterized protein (DUF924 family)
MPNMRAQTVLDFWFLPPGSAGHGAARDQWFRKDAQFDARIRHEFGALVGIALNGGLREWDALGPEGALARILVLDQFTRNTGRDTPAAFAGDRLALEAAQGMVAAGTDRLLLPVQRWFAYMPFEHAEDRALQDQSLALFAQLNETGPGFGGVLDYARSHRDVIARFGRFPHRNRILGRASTPEEAAFLNLPGSGF